MKLGISKSLVDFEFMQTDQGRETAIAGAVGTLNNPTLITNPSQEQLHTTSGPSKEKTDESK